MIWMDWSDGEEGTFGRWPRRKISGNFHSYVNRSGSLPRDCDELPPDDQQQEMNCQDEPTGIELTTGYESMLGRPIGLWIEWMKTADELTKDKLIDNIELMALDAVDDKLTTDIDDCWCHGMMLSRANWYWLVGGICITLSMSWHWRILKEEELSKKITTTGIDIMLNFLKISFTNILTKSLDPNQLPVIPYILTSEYSSSHDVSTD